MASPTDIRLDGSVLDGSSVNASLSEASQSGTLIGRLSASDADAGDTITFSLISDAGGAVFLEGNQLRLSEGALLDADQPNLTVTLRARDASGNQITRTLVIDVQDNENHTVIRGSAASETLDAVGLARQYILAGAGDDTITADDQDMVVLSGRRSDYDISITQIDGGGGDGYGGGGDTQNQITITDLRAGGPDGSDLVLDAGFFRFADGTYSLEQLDTSLGTGLALDGRVLGLAKYLEENATIGTEVGQLSIRGLPGNPAPVVTSFEVLAFSEGDIFPDTLTGAANPFAIDESGLITVTGSVDFETHYQFALRVHYQDAAGNPYFNVIDITVLDADDPPEMTVAPGQHAPLRIGNYLDTSQDVALGALSVFDHDGSSGTVSFVLGGADAGKFVVRDGQLFLRAGVNIDTGAPFDFDLTIRAQDSSLPAGSGVAVDLDIGVVTPDPLDALRWDYTAPGTIRVYLAPGGLQASEGLALDEDVRFSDPYVTLAWTEAQRARIEAAFASFSDVLNVQFSFVTDLAEADFAMLASADGGGAGTLAYWAVGGGTLDLGGVQAQLEGWGRIGMAGLDGYGFAAGSLGYYALIHEIGHGMGLAHPHDAGGGSVVMEGVEDERDSYGAFDLNQAPFTIMSYNDQWETGPLTNSDGDAQGRLATLGALDIAVLQRVYGANTATRTGDDIYDLPLTATTDSRFATIWDAGGKDTIRYAGTADATISLQAATLGYAASGGGVVSFVSGIEGGFTIAAGVMIENATGGGGADDITGNGGANHLAGGLGNDTLDGGAGIDTLDGGAGGDSMLGGSGNDLFLIDSAADRADGGAGVDGAQSATLSLNLAAASLSLIENATLTGALALNLTGSGSANRLTGNGGANRLTGAAGNDTLDGGAGSDLLDGGDGNDLLIVERAADQARGGAGLDTVQSASLSLNLTSANLSQIENASLSGSVGLALTGNGGANRLTGNAGANRIAGGLGADTLTGGAGHDSFVFNTAASAANIDRISDYRFADDSILLENAVFAGLTAGRLAASAFVANALGRATDALDRVIFETDTGKLFFDRDGSGRQAQVQIALVSADRALVAAEFLVI